MKRRSPGRAAREPAPDTVAGRKGKSGGGRLRALALPAALAGLFALVAVTIGERPTGRSPERARRGEEIVVEGALLSIGTPVVLWFDPGGYDASIPRCFFDPARVLPRRPAPGCDAPERIGPRSGAGDLRSRITQFVLHYDMSYTSRNCFRVVHDLRGLSVHFMLDLDGTIYQTCDVSVRARHARAANDRSVGVEIAHPGALESDPRLRARYRRDARGVYLELPDWLAKEPLRTRGYVARPAREEPVRGVIQGRVQTQFDFTEDQYRALARLAAGLSRALPLIELEAPRDEGGAIRSRAFASERESEAFRGVLAHYHLQTDKLDPGPAFDWERFLALARRIRSGEGEGAR